MSIDILNMRRFDENNQAIDVALPVLAVECEATPPLENYLDAYEETVLKLISLGLSSRGISKTLNAPESLIEEILAQLERKKYAVREIGRPWKLTEDGEKYLDGSIHERASTESKFGYMFINTIKKEVLPYFLEGDVGQVSLFKGETLPLKLTIEGNEVQTFAPIEIKHAKLKKAYRTYFKNLKLIDDYDSGEISKEEAVDLFADLDSFEEENDEDEKNTTISLRKATTLTGNMFIRSLEKKPTKLYLRMRIIIDPSYPGGYRAESPFDFGGIDNNFFLRQVQWMEQSETAYLNGETIQDFLHREICKLSPSYKSSVKDFQVFILEKMPLLKRYRSHIPYVYEDMERIYSLMQRQSSLLEKENIVNNLARCIVEGLFNTFFRDIGQERLHQIQQKAFDDVNAYGDSAYKKRICGNAHLNKDMLDWVRTVYLKTLLRRLTLTYGNSIIEKFINILVIEYHLSSPKIHKFLSQPNLDQTYMLIDELNRIRRKVSHDTNDRFTNNDYEFYMTHVFDLINSLLKAFEED